MNQNDRISESIWEQLSTQSDYNQSDNNQSDNNQSDIYSNIYQSDIYDNESDNIDISLSDEIFRQFLEINQSNSPPPYEYSFFDKNSPTSTKGCKKDFFYSSLNNDCTFTPEISKNSRQMVCTDFKDRQDAFKSKRSKNQRNGQLMRNAKEMAECSFQPSVSCRASLREGDLIQRLTQTRRSKKCDDIHAELLKKAEEDEKNCTFRPKINKNIVPRKNRHKSVQEEANYSFKPETNPIPTHMASVRNYLNENAFDRLSRSRDCYIDDSRPLPPSCSVVENADKTIANFLSRQSFQDTLKKQNLEILREAYSSSFRPYISDNTRKMAEEGRARPKNRKSKMSWTEELTFHPRINESSKMLPSPSISDLVDGNICQKFEKIKNKKNQIEEDEEKNLTFRVFYYIYIYILFLNIYLYMIIFEAPN
eukprot:GHVL01031891.1.p1 GENE.GHVL01031891.1~~GHVL01031891.1.p1  ORF type:complete len:422 (+),score=96.72 GHVL01031891.1:76-1341(+)